jgi:hypothetical protein
MQQCAHAARVDGLLPEAVSATNGLNESVVETFVRLVEAPKTH